MSSARSFALLLALACACSKSDAGSEDARAGASSSANDRQRGSAPPRADGPCGRIALAVGDPEAAVAAAIMPAASDPNSPQVRELSRETEASIYPAAVSPDGRTLLVLSSTPLPDGTTSDRLGLVELDRDRAELRPFGPEGAAIRNPTWAPDGNWIAFETNARSFRDLYRLELGTDTPLRLTDDPEGNFEPAISPDGRRIAFVSSRDGNAELYLMTADGGAPQRLTESPGDDTAPAWSPDGTTLAFRSARARERGIDVFVLDVDGAGEPRPAVRDGSRDVAVITRDLAWSPTGELLAFTELRQQAGAAAIAIVDPRAGAVRVRSAGPGIDERPSWSGDGAWLAFARGEAGGRSDIAIMRADGSSLAVLTEGLEPGVRWRPLWVADPDCARARVSIERPSTRG